MAPLVGMIGMIVWCFDGERLWIRIMPADREPRARTKKAA